MSGNVALDLSKDTFVVVTGASQGIGRQIAVTISQQLTKNSALLLLARSESGLNETKSKCLVENASLQIHIKPMNLTAPTNEEIQTALTLALSGSKFKNAIIFHNVGVMGNIQQQAHELTDRRELVDFYQLNMITPAILNSLFVKNVRDRDVSNVYVVDITSVCARSPFKYMAMYCAVKATRDMFFKVMAVEDESVNVLIYSPGPIKTDMFQYVVDNLGSESDRKYLTQILCGDSILTAEQTCEKMMRILTEGDYKSGDIVDYYDRP